MGMHTYSLYHHGVAIAHAIGADITKIGMNLTRPRPVAAGKFHPDVMAQLDAVAEKVTSVLDQVEK